jgi:hypothetical protein
MFHEHNVRLPAKDTGRGADQYLKHQAALVLICAKTYRNPLEPLKSIKPLERS